jgi:CheY-like chemotaxis protein
MRQSALQMPPLRILQVEDDPDDAFFFSRAIKRANPECQLHRVINGEGAIDYLRKAAETGQPNSPPMPDLMVVDLKLPGLSGFDVLAWTRAQTAYQRLPIVVLSGSPLPQDEKKATELGASDFIVKESEYDKIAAKVFGLIAKHSPPAPGAGPDQSARPPA